jgi:hypothetical protein
MRQDKISIEHPYTTLHFSIKRGHNWIIFWNYWRSDVRLENDPWDTTVDRADSFPQHTPTLRAPRPCLLFMCPPWGRTNGDCWRPMPAAPRVRMDSCGLSPRTRTLPPSLRCAPSLGPPPLSVWAGLKSRSPARYALVRWSQLYRVPSPGAWAVRSSLTVTP